MANKLLQQLVQKRVLNKAKASLKAATPVVEDPTLQTWIKEVSSTIKDIAGSSVRKSELVKAGIVTITNGELQNALTPNEEVNLTVPAAVLNLTANGAYGSITLVWETRPSKYFGQNNIYRSEIDDFGTATQIGSTLSDVYTDYVGNNIKAYYWVRTISKFGIEGDISPSAYAATAIDVAYVLEQLEGHITLSQLDQILRGEISAISDIANGLQEEARLRVLELAALADQLRQESINKAQEIQDKVDGVNAAIQQQIIGLNDGITTEVNSRLDGDQKSINALEAYKLSNDNAVGTILNKVDLAISTNEVQATTIAGLQTNFETVSGELATKADASNLTLAENKIAEVEGRVVATTENITALGSRVSTVEDEISTKADSSVLVDYATKSETDSAIASKIESYDASLVIGGSNLLNATATLSNTEETYKGGKIYRQYRTAADTDTDDFIVNVVDLDAGDYTLSFDIKASIDVPSMSSNLSYFFSPNNTTKIVTSQGYTAHNSDGRAEKRITTGWQRISITWSQSSATSSKNMIINRIYGIGIDYTVDIANIKFEKGNKATAWTPSNSDTQNALNANATAISQTNATVNALEGVVTSHSSSITSLGNEVVNLNTNTANVSDAVSVLSSKVDSHEGFITNQASSIVKLDAAIKANTASDNLIPNPTFDSAYDQMGYTVVPSTNPEVPSNCPYTFVAKLNSRDNVPNIEDIACTAGDVYEISAYVACAQGTHNFNLMVFEKDFKDGNNLGFPSGGGLAPTSVWTKRVWRWTVRDGVTFFKPLLQIDTFDNSTVWYVTNWKVTNISAAAKAQSTADATANTLVSTNATVSKQGDQIIANTASIQSAESRIANTESSIQNIQSTYATRDSVGSLAQTALKSVWQDDITKAVGDISVGGVNLLSNTAYLSASNPPQVLGGSGYFLSGFNPNYHAGTSSTGENHFVIDNVYAERYMRIQAAVSNTSTLKPNSTYTFSVKIRGAAKPLGFRIIVRRNGVFTDLPIKMIEYDNDVFSTHGYTFTIPTETTDIIISLQSYSTNLGESFALQNSSMKLEEGNVITAWTPSVLDVQAQIDASAIAISSLDTKVANIDGTVSAQASQITTLTSDNAANKNALAIQANVINGVRASYMVKMETNGVIGGFGMVQETGALGNVTTSFGVNANTFFIGSPSSNKKPFAVLGSSGSINGVTVPAGTYIDTAYIPDGTITNAKIGNLSADKITAGNIAADRMKANIVAAAQGQFTSLSSISATIGVLRTSTYGARTEIKDNLIEVYDSSGKLRVRLGVW